MAAPSSINSNRTSRQDLETGYCIIRACRPRGMISVDKGNRVSAVANHQLGGLQNLQDFTREEVIAMKIVVAEIAGKPASLSDKQKELEKKLMPLTRGIVTPQFNPLTLLMFDIYYCIEQTTLKSNLKNKFILGLHTSFKVFSEYFRDKESEQFSQFASFFSGTFIKDLKELQREVENKAGPSERGHFGPLIEKCELLEECLKDREGLFPLLLVPSHVNPNGFLSVENLLFLKKVAWFCALSFETFQAKKGELLAPFIRAVKSSSLSKKEKNKIINEASTLFDEKKVKYLIEKINVLNAFAQAAPVAKGKVFNPKQLDEMHQMLQKISIEYDEILVVYHELLKIFKDNQKNLLDSVNHHPELLEIHSDCMSMLTKTCDFWVADSFHYFCILLGTLSQAQQKLNQLTIKTEALKKEFSALERASVPSYHLRHSDLIIHRLLTEGIALFSGHLSAQDKADIESLLFCIGALPRLFSTMTVSSYLSFQSDRSQAQKNTNACAIVQNTRRGEIHSLKQSLARFPKQLERLNTIDRLFAALESVLVESAVDAEAQLSPFLIFMNKRTREEGTFTPDLLRYFNQQLKITQTLFKNFPLEQFEPLLHLLRFSPRSEKKESDGRIVKAVITNIHLLTKICEHIISIKPFTDKKECLAFANTLVKLEELYTSWEELTEEIPNIRSELAGLLEFNRATIKPKREEEEWNSFVNEFCNRYTEPFLAFNHHLFNLYTALFEWAKEEALFPSSPKVQQPRLAAPETKVLPSPAFSSTAAVAAPISKKNEEAPLIASDPLHSLQLECRSLLKSIRSLNPTSDDPEIHHLARGQISNALELLSTHYLPLLQEQMGSALSSSATPYLHAQTLLLNSALAVEQALQLKLALHHPSKVKEWINSHQLAGLAAAAKIELGKEELALLEEAGKVAPITSRYLWRTEGGIAELLSSCAERGSPQKAREYAHSLLRIVSKVLQTLSSFPSASSAVPPLPLAQAAVREKELPWCDAMRPLLEQIDSHLSKLSFTHTAARWGRLSLGPVWLKGDALRERQILDGAKNSSFYLSAIEQTLPQLFRSPDFYSQTLFLLEKTALLLEQTMLAMAAYLPIASEKEKNTHILLEKIGGEMRQRYRYFDHNLFRTLGLLESFLGEERLGLTSSQQKAIARLAYFAVDETRYPTMLKQGGLFSEMRELRTLSTLYTRSLEGGFFEEGEHKELRKRYGANQEEWGKRLLDDITRFGIEELGPLVGEALSAANRLLELFHDLRY